MSSPFTPGAIYRILMCGYSYLLQSYQKFERYNFSVLLPAEVVQKIEVNLPFC